MKATLAFNELSNLTSGGFFFFLAAKLAELFVPVVSLDQALKCLICSSCFAKM